MKQCTGRFRTLLLLLLAGLLLPGSGRAEELDLKTALVLGLKNNFDLKVVELDVTRADGGVLSQEGRFDIIAEIVAGKSESETPVASSFYPVDTIDGETLSGEASLAKQFDFGLQSRLSLRGEKFEGVAGDGLSDQLDPVYHANLVLDLSQPLLKDFGWAANSADLKIAETRRLQAALGYLGRAEQLVAEIEAAYLELLQASEDYEDYVLARELAIELQRGNQRKFEAGLIPVTELNESRSAVAGRQEAMLLAEQRVTLARDALADLLVHGEVVLPPEWQVAYPLIEGQTTPSLDKALQVGLSQRHDLRRARLEADVRKLELAYADNQLWPRLDLEGSLGLNGLAGDDSGAGSIYAGNWSDALDGALEQDGSQWYAGLRFSVPLQNRTARGLFRVAEAEKRQALYQLKRTEVAVETSIRSARAALELGEKRLATAEQFVQLANTTFEQENRRLAEGLSDTFRVLLFQNALIDARIRETAARIDYYKALNALYRAMGTNLERYAIVAALPYQGATP